MDICFEWYSNDMNRERIRKARNMSQVGFKIICAGAISSFFYPSSSSLLSSDILPIIAPLRDCEEVTLNLFSQMTLLSAVTVTCDMSAVLLCESGVWVSLLLCESGAGCRHTADCNDCTLRGGYHCNPHIIPSSIPFVIGIT